MDPVSGFVLATGQKKPRLEAFGCRERTIPAVISASRRDYLRAFVSLLAEV
jgi:hypothetical protein